ncbi:HtaA domain-containing protein [Streptomyces sp. NPDC020379]|uniref:HtaA domain-containing protein n=1 Tax=Streptomyces sp. NPDC020379 TaxID=3365071 RepID=UPI0037AF5456
MTVTARRAALAALATATALGATVLTAPAYAAEAPHAQPKADAPTQLTEGKLTWGVKKSLREDIKTNGLITPTGVQQAKDNGEFTFTEDKASYDTSTQAISATFKGSVQFQGHQKADKSYKFDLKLSDLEVVTAPKSQGKGSIKATVTKDGKETKKVQIATLDYVEHGVADAPYSFEKIAAKLTKAGAEAFTHEGEDGKKEEPYKAEEEIDPIAFSGAKAVTGEPTDKGNNAGNQGNEGKNNGNTGGANGGQNGKDSGDANKEDSQKAETKVVDGNLDWGLSETLRKYVDDSNGKATVSGGAERFKGGYRFTKGEGKYVAKDSTLDVTFKGAVRFTGHGSKLDLQFTDFKLNVTGKTGTVSAKVTSDSDTVLADKATLAELTVVDPLELKDGVLGLSKLPAKLAKGAGKAFKYGSRDIVKEGDALDPLTANVATVNGAKLPDMPSDTGSDKSTDTTGNTGATATNTSTTTGGTASTGGTATATDTTASGALASTGANTPTGPLLGGAAALIAVGGGAVYAARRRKAGQQG